MIDVALLVMVLVAFAIAVALELVVRRRRQRRARRPADAVFLADVARLMQTKRRVRPRVDARIQRRRFGS